MVAKQELLPPPNLGFKPKTATLFSEALNFLAISALMLAFLTPADSG